MGKRKRGSWGFASGDPRRGQAANEVNYEDPKSVDLELKRIDGHRIATRERMIAQQQELEKLKVLLEEAPKRIQILAKSVDDDVKRLESLDEKYVKTLMLKGGAKLADQIAKLAKKKKALEKEIAEDKVRGGPRPKPTAVYKQPKSGETDSKYGTVNPGIDANYAPKERL